MSIRDKEIRMKVDGRSGILHLPPLSLIHLLVSNGLEKPPFSLHPFPQTFPRVHATETSFRIQLPRPCFFFSPPLPSSERNFIRQSSRKSWNGCRLPLQVHEASPCWPKICIFKLQPLSPPLIERAENFLYNLYIVWFRGEQSLSCALWRKLGREGGESWGGKGKEGIIFAV